jgi:hypothetical protein
VTHLSRSVLSPQISTRRGVLPCAREFAPKMRRKIPKKKTKTQDGELIGTGNIYCLMSNKISPMRTVGYDPGLLSREELLATHTGTRRRTLQDLIQREKLNRRSRMVLLLKRAVKAVRWFIDNARLRISVRDYSTTSILWRHAIYSFTHLL